MNEPKTSAHIPQSAADPVFVAGHRLWPPSGEVTGALVDVDGEPFYRVSDYDAVPPFLMSLVSDSDHWLFISSNGALTAGRRSPDHALFPYYTDDRVHDAHADTGSVTIVHVHTADGRLLWEPFSTRYAGAYRISRNLSKSTVGNRLRFEEVNHDLALTFSYSWSLSERFGFVRTAVLANDGDRPVEVELVDGLQNLVPAGTERYFQEHFSTLVDGHKDNELDAATGLALLRLSSLPGDSPKPGEALRTAVAWSRGLPGTVHLLSARQLDGFRAGAAVTAETRVRGRRGAYLVHAKVGLAAGEHRRWIVVTDTDHDAADVIRLRRLLSSADDVTAEVDADVRRGTDALIGIVAAADGLQTTGDPLSAARHFSNTLFNVMRGGIPDDGYTVTRRDIATYLASVSPGVYRRVGEAFLDGLPERLPHADLLAAAERHGDPDLERLVYEYLPLTFSRRHGDPSRPWNDFAIAVKDEHGQKVLGYQGNWRDIFQNWEALAYSFPEYVESMIFRFVNASTADGHNPYRLTRAGFDWEVDDPTDPWSHVGYWGDHQIIYLLRLLETSARFHPGRLPALLTRRLFTYADVPYRIKPYQALLDNPRDTVEFDASRHAELQHRIADQGAVLLDGDGAPLRVTLAEKLLVPALAKLGSYLPGAGIWLNTQRPEWNDANNALVGYGVSMVTLYQLRRYLAFCRGLFATLGSFVDISTEVATFLHRISAALAEHRHLLDGVVTDRDRRTVLDALGTAASDYRTGMYDTGLSGARTAVSVAELDAFCALALRHVDHTVRANRRDDGLYHSYNLMRVHPEGIAVRRLYEMLEGQVAVLSSGVLDRYESAALLDALRASSMYREDQNSYLLYPQRRLPRFLEKNVLPVDALERSKLLAELAARGDPRIVVRDDDGGLHFNADFANAERLDAALGALLDDQGLRELVEADRDAVLDLYEEVFDHQSFTGRSGTFYKYEGLGCIYWHMVSKLLLAIEEVRAGAGSATDRPDEAVTDRLRTHYEAVRDGIGVHKSPRVHGAIPTDPYSHTPAFAGAQQPGMTGQVKEDIISRLGELGLTVVAGRIRFRADLVRPVEFRTEPGLLRYVDVHGTTREVPIPVDGYGFTFGQVPVVVRRGGPARVVVTTAGVPATAQDRLELDEATSAAVFGRTGTVERIDVHLP